MANERTNPTPRPPAEETVAVPVSVLEALTKRLETLEHASRVQAEMLVNSRAAILDPEYEKWKAEVSRPTKERSQDVADRTYGTTGKRFRCFLNSITEDGKPGPKIDEHPQLVIAANSDLEAKGRYQQLCGIRKHEYRVEAIPVAA